MIKEYISIDLVKYFAYGTSKDLIREKQEIKSDNINKILRKMINFDDITKEKNKRTQPQIPTYPYIILIIVIIKIFNIMYV